MDHKNKITLRTFQDKDVDMFTTWLHKDYIMKWYHEPEDWLSEINRRHDEYAWIHHFIVMYSEHQSGFANITIATMQRILRTGIQSPSVAIHIA